MWGGGVLWGGVGVVIACGGEECCGGSGGSDCMWGEVVREWG